jgi:putative peptide zinc metalloprotease protein
MAESAGEQFWTAVSAALDPGSYKPRRVSHVEVARLRSEGEPYYVLKQPETRQYLRLSERDYALWWQMDGGKSVKDLLLYNLRRYRSLPVAHINRLVTDLRNGRFLQDTPTNLYDQLDEALTARSPENRGRRLLRGFLHSEFAFGGLDPFFSDLYRWFSWLFARPAQWFLLLLIIIGGLLYGRYFFAADIRLLSGGLTLLTLLLVNFGVIVVHELAHGLAVKRVGRELNRGGFLIYWGMPAFFVDTRDTWLSTRKERILVSWAGPHSGLLIGGLAGFGLVILSIATPDLAASLPAIILLQIGFIAYLTVFFNLNPLLELDGYFILMDWLDMPGLRQRAFRFWRQDAWPRFQATRAQASQANQQGSDGGQAKQETRSLFAPFRLFWQSLARHERIFAFFGVLAFLYSAYALWFALYFWQSRLLPLAQQLWREGGWWSHALLLALTTAVILPTIYALFRYGWGRLHAALAWLARRELLARGDVLALLIGVPLLIGLPLLLFGLTLLPAANLSIYLIIWLVHLAALAALAGVARQLAGSRFQWSIWSLCFAFAAITFAWVSPANSIWREGGLAVAAAGVLAASLVAWFTIRPDNLTRPERLLMGGFFLLGIGYLVALLWLGDNGRYLPILLTLMCLFPGLIFFTPLLLNFWRSRFGLPWLLLVIGCLLIPWLHLYPGLHLPTAVFWLYAALLYLLLGALAQFSRADIPPADADLFDDRKRLVDAFNHFMQALFASYEIVFGRRRLQKIYLEIIALGPIEPDEAILPIAGRCRRALLLAVDRLDDLAGTPFTRRAGQAAYDSLPWLEAETLARHVLSETAWGSALATGFIRKRDRRRILLREADIFAGFDEAGLEELLAVVRVVNGRSGQTLAHAGRDATAFYLLESGQVGVFRDGVQVATLEPGGYFGIPALQEQGSYRATYQALTPVTLFAIDRARFSPLLRANANLAAQVSSAAHSRRLLGRMPLFSSLSPQQLTMLDARLRHRTVSAGEQIVRQGQARSDLLIVASGELLVVEEGEEGERIVGRLGPGEHFGEYALFADLPYLASLRAAVDSELYLLDEATFDQVTANCDRLSHYVEQVGSGRLLARRRRLDYTAILS